MNDQLKKGKKKTHASKLDNLLRRIGNAFKRQRKGLGYSSSIAFAVSKNISETQYGKYEAGSENMTIETFLNTADLLGLSEEDIFNPNFLALSNNDNSLIEKSKSHLINQVRYQVTLLRGEKKANEFSNDDLERLYIIIASCNIQLSKKQIIKKLGLKSKTPNLENLIKFAISSEWISMTNPEKPNSSNQKYYTTEKGKEILKFDGLN